MLPFADQTITLYIKSNNEFIRSVVDNCTWGKSDAVVTVGTVTIGSDDFKVQIPEEAGVLELLPGDVIVRGAVDDEIPAKTSPTALLAKYKGKSFTIRVAYDYTGKPLGHYEVMGK